MLDSQVAQQIQSELAAILASPEFQKAPTLGRLLTYLVTEEQSGRAHELKETTIAHGLFGRAPTYDPKIDSVVRVNATRLRLRLQEYYAEYYAAHRSSPIRIQLLKGSYVPVYTVPPQPLAPPAVSSARPQLAAPISPRPNPGRAYVVGFAIALACIVSAAFILIRFPRPIEANEVWSVRPFARLGGGQSFADFSPDARQLAFVWSGPQNSRDNIYIQDLASDTPHRLTSDDAEETRPSWAPDGSAIAYIRSGLHGTKQVDIFSFATHSTTTVAKLESREPWLCVIPRLSWSRDGTTLFTSGTAPGTVGCGLVALDIHTHQVRRITQPPAGAIHDLEAAVSPAGTSIAFLRTFGFRTSDIYSVNLDGSHLQRITSDMSDILGFHWSADGKTLLVASRREDGVLRLWRVGVDGGSPRQLTDGTSGVGFPTVTPGGDRIVFTNYRSITNLQLRTASGTTRILADRSDNTNPQISPDGAHMLYSSDRTGSTAIWISDLDGRNARRLANSDSSSGLNAAWSPDSTRIALECRENRITNICMVAADGSGAMLHLTRASSNNVLPSWSHDGHSIYYTSDTSGHWQIYRQSLFGGTPVQLTFHGGMRAIEAPDGTALYVHRGEPLGGIIRLPGAMPSGEAEEHVLLPALGGAAWGDWDLAHDGIFFFTRTPENRPAQMNKYLFSTGRLRTLFTAEAPLPQSGRNFSVSPDGTSFLIEQNSNTQELDIMERRPPSHRGP